MLKTKKQSGFSLLEVLISVAIVAIGLLGLAAMQTVGLQQNQSAYFRSQAAQFAYDITDRMRANRGVNGNNIDSYLTADPSSKALNTGCYAAGCLPVPMADNDLREWYNTYIQAFPGSNATGTISKREVAGETTYRVTIKWDDNRDGSVDNDDPDFTTDFKP